MATGGSTARVSRDDRNYFQPFGFYFNMILGPMTAEKPANDNNDRWMDLCEKAAAEHDSEKLHQLILEIDHLLEERELRTRNPNQSQ
jgi:hypothetical protein